jgi:hypothetical protein
VVQFAGAAVTLSLHDVEHTRETVGLAGASFYTGAVGVTACFPIAIGATDAKPQDQSKRGKDRHEGPRNAIHAVIIA